MVLFFLELLVDKRKKKQLYNLFSHFGRPSENDFGNEFNQFLEKSIFGNFLWRVCIRDVEKMRFSISNKSVSGVRFSEPARKMTQNGGRVVPI